MIHATCARSSGSTLQEKGGVLIGRSYFTANNIADLHEPLGHLNGCSGSKGADGGAARPGIRNLPRLSYVRTIDLDCHHTYKRSYLGTL